MRNFTHSSGRRPSLKLLLFLTAVAVVTATGGVLLRHASHHPVRLDIPKAPPAGVRDTVSPDATDVDAETSDPPVEPDPGIAGAAGEVRTQKASLPPARKDDAGPPGPEVLGSPDNERRPAAEKRFQAMMSEGMAALERKDYYAAQDALIRAKEIRPESSEVRDVLAQVDAAVRLEWIHDLKKTAAAAEQTEDWHRALKDYTAALGIDGTLRFALEGKARAVERRLMDQRFRYYLDRPDAPASDEALQKALDLLESAEAVSAKGPRLRSQIEALRQKIRIAQTPVKVVLESDGFTEVAVYKVGKFGRFPEKELYLRPGTYTIVGTRDGYKDVRQTLAVPADAARPLHIVIRCEEAL